jgi:hypothetical protein
MVSKPDGSDVEKIEREMQALLDTLDYRWSAFTLADFTGYVQGCTGKQIVFVLHGLKSASGGWVATADRDYVFIGADLPVFMQNHSALHELAHIVCRHPSARLGDVLCGEDVSSTHLLLRDVCSEEIDLQAEAMASLFQERITVHGRMKELTRVLSSAEGMATFLTALDLA